MKASAMPQQGSEYRLLRDHSHPTECHLEDSSGKRFMKPPNVITATRCVTQRGSPRKIRWIGTDIGSVGDLRTKNFEHSMQFGVDGTWATRGVPLRRRTPRTREERTCTTHIEIWFCGEFAMPPRPIN